MTASRRDQQCGVGAHGSRSWWVLRSSRGERLQDERRRALRESGRAGAAGSREGRLRADLGVVGVVGSEVAVDRLGVRGCRGCAAQNGDLRAAESGCRARNRGKSLRLLAMWEAHRAPGRVRARWWAAICRGRRMHVAASEKPPRGSARRGGSAAVLWRERQPAAVGVTRSLIDGSVSSAHLRLERCRRGLGGCSTRVSRSSAFEFVLRWLGPLWTGAGAADWPISTSLHLLAPLELLGADGGGQMRPTAVTVRFADAIAVEARGREGVGSRRPGRGGVGVLVAAALLAGVALIAAAALVGVRGGVSSARSPARASAAGGFARLPVPLRGLVSGTVGRSERAFWVRRAGAGFLSVNGAQGFSARFSDSGVRVFARGGRLVLSLAGVGYGVVVEGAWASGAERGSKPCLVRRPGAYAVV